MTLIKTSFWSSIAVFFKMMTGFIMVKVIALYSGPTGLAMIGQFQNLIQTAQSFSGSLIQQGVVKYVAEYRDDIERKSRILSSATVLCVSISIVSGMVLLLLRAYIADYLNLAAYESILTFFACTLILLSLNIFLYSVLNGEREIAKYNLCNIANSIFGLVAMTYLIARYNLYGGLLALVMSQSVIFFFTLIAVTKSKWFKLRDFMQGIDRDSLYKLSKYALMAMVSSLVLPIAQMIIRHYIENHLSWQDAGLWQGMMRISDAYLLIITTTLGIYYLPKLAELQTTHDLKKEILTGYKIILPIIIMLASGVFLFRYYIVRLLFSPQFLPMMALFKYQLLGDILKIGSWLLAYLMLAKAMTKSYILTELFFSFSYVVLTIMCVHHFGLVGATLAFAINYGLYWICVAFITRRHYQ